MIVFDTNVVSELMKPSASTVVTAWMRARGAAELFTTSITLAEVLYGIERLPGGRRKDLLKTTAEDVFAAFADQLLAFDAAAASEYARLVGSRERAGAPIEASTHRSPRSAGCTARPWRPATSRTSTTRGSTSSTRGAATRDAPASRAGHGRG